MISTVLIDGRNANRTGYERILSSHPEIEFVGRAKRAADFDFATVGVDLVIVGGDSPAALSSVPGLPAGCATILFCPGTAAAGVLAALSRRGPTAILAPAVDSVELLFAVSAVMRGAYYVSAEVVRRAASPDPRIELGPEPASLSPREVDIAVLLAQGLTYRQVARRLSLTEATVSTYGKRARTKLGVVNNAELTKRIIELGYFQFS